MKHLLNGGAILLVLVLVVGTVTGSMGTTPALQTGPGNIIIPLPAQEITGTEENGFESDRNPAEGTNPIVTIAAGSAVPGLSERPGIFETTSSVGRFGWTYLDPYPAKIGNQTNVAVISRSPGQVDLVYWTCAEVTPSCTLNTTGKSLGAVNPEFSSETAITPALDHRFSPAVYSMNETHLGAFFVGQSRNLYQVQWTSAAGWQPYTTVFSRVANSTPGAVSRFNGNIELVYVDNVTYSLVHRSYNSGTWSDGEIIADPGSVTSEGASIVSTTSDSFDVLIHNPVDNHTWIRHWSQTGGWEDWSDTGLVSYSYIGASTRPFSDRGGTTKSIDIITNISSTKSIYYWYVSNDSGMTWYNESFTDLGYVMVLGGPFTGVSPVYNRLEFYQEYATSKVWKMSFRLPTHEKIGAYKDGIWNLDDDASFSWTAGDKYYAFGPTGAVPVFGDWNGDGSTEIGAFTDGSWLLDYNGNGVYDGDVVDRAFSFGSPGYKPVIGDWNSDGRDEIGVELDGFWVIDYNGNYVWDGQPTDKFAAFGQPDDNPVVGDWNGDGIIEIGSEKDGFWSIDFNGNYVWEGEVIDRFAAFGQANDNPIVGDWNGNGITKIGSEKDGFWSVDYNGNFVWDYPLDKFAGFGRPMDKPRIGDWNEDGKTEIASFTDGFWAVDYNGNYVWDGQPTDKFSGFGSPGATPLAGEWN